MQSNFQTPTGWSRTRLGDVAEVVGGSTPSRAKAEYWGGNIPWVAPSELTDLDGRYLDCSRESISEQGRKAAGLRILPPGSVLLTSRATVGATAINKVAVTTNQGFQSLVPNPETDGLWLYYGVSALRRELERRSAGSTFREISRDGVRSLPILLPPLHEQRAIAAILDSIDEAIERTEEVIVATERLRDALLHDLLTRGLPGRHTEFKQVRGLGTIPASWDVVRLGDVCERPEYGASAPARPHDPALPRYVRITDITDDGRLKMDDLRSAEPEKTRGYELHEGDLLFARSGSVGRTYRYTSKDGSCVYAGYLIRFRALRKVALPEFLELCTRSGFYHKWVESILRQGAQPNINAAEYASLRIPLPALDEQRRISQSIACLTRSIEDSQQATHVLRVAKAAASHHLLKGELRVSGHKFRREGIER